MIRPKSKLPFIFQDESNDIISSFYIKSEGNKNIKGVDEKQTLWIAWDSLSQEDLDLLEHAKQDFEFIIHACNNYEKLINQIKGLMLLDEFNVFNSQQLLKQLEEIK